MKQSELVTYFERSPDPMVPGCRNTGAEGVDGVVFNGVEPMVGVFEFIGRQSILEAAAVLFDLSPDEVTERLSADQEAKTRRTRKKGVNGTEVTD